MFRLFVLADENGIIIFDSLDKFKREVGGFKTRSGLWKAIQKLNKLGVLEYFKAGEIGDKSFIRLGGALWIKNL